MSDVEAKITLYWDKEFKARAKQFAEDKGTSLSKLTKKMLGELMENTTEVTVSLPRDLLEPVRKVAESKGQSVDNAVQYILVKLLEDSDIGG